jgi:hypothetical protein
MIPVAKTELAVAPTYGCTVEYLLDHAKAIAWHHDELWPPGYDSIGD